MTISIEMRLQAIEDEMNLKRLVDTFANLADVRDFDGQMQLFTDDAVVETYIGETLFAKMKGRAEIKQVFTSFTAAFPQMFHMNGQFSVSLAGDRATAVHYCTVTLIGSTDAGTNSMNSNGVVYHDDYVRTPEGWRIEKRVARFVWRNTTEMSPA